MPKVSVTCPNPDCEATYEVAEQSLGRKGKCKSCGKPFRLTTGTVFHINDFDPPSENSDEASLDSADSRPQWMGSPADTDDGQHSRTRTTPAQSSPSTPPSLDSGDSLGRFELKELLGAGGFGNVYLAYDPVLDREVALKLPQAEAFENQDSAEAFLAEARAAAQLRHPNIVPIYDAGRTDTSFYIASAFIAGRPLSDAISEQGMFSAEDAVETVIALAGALGYAHQQRIVHRDVKPHNVMIDTNGQPHLMDFGLARALDATGQFKAKGRISGTPAYMSPEQASGSKQATIGPASDQYSLGAVLYELLTGERPFEGPPDIVLYNVRKTEPPAPSTIQPQLPVDLEAICLKAMSKDEGDRYATCEELADDLRRWQEGRPIHARKVSSLERLRKWARRSPAVASLLSLTIAGLLTMLIGSQWYNAQLGTALEEAQANLQAAQQTVDDILELIRSDEFKQVPGVQPLQEDLAAAVRTRYEVLTEKYPDSVELKAGLARSKMTHAIVTLDIGSGEQALDELKESRVMQQDLVDSYPEETSYRFDLGQTLFYMGHWHWVNRRYAESLPPLNESEQLLTRLHSDMPEDDEVIEELGYVYNSIGNAKRNSSPDHHDASRAFLKSREWFQLLVDRHPGNLKYTSRLSLPTHNLALICEDQGEYEAALTYLDECSEIDKNVLQSDVATERTESNYALSLRNRARLLLITDRLDDATKASEEAVERGRAVVAANPHVHYYRTTLAGHLKLRADLHLRQKEYDQATSLFEESINILDESVELGSGTSIVATDILSAYVDLANLHGSRKGPVASDNATGGEGNASKSRQNQSPKETDSGNREAVAALDAAIERGVDFSKRFSDDAAVNWEYARVLFKRGLEEVRSKNDARAVPFFDRSLEVIQQYVLQHKEHSKHHQYVRWYLEYLGSAADAAARAELPDKVIEYVDAGIPVGKTAEDRESKQNVCRLLSMQADIYREKDQLEDAVAALKDSLSISEPQLEEHPWHWYFRQSVAGTYRKLADIYQGASDLKNEWDARRKYVEVWGKPLQNMKVDRLLARSGSPSTKDATELREAMDSAWNMKKFTVPVQFGAKTAPFDVYITSVPPGTDPLEDQARWLWEERRGVIGKDIRESFRKLHALAIKNNVSFPDLCVYALESANKEKEDGKKASSK